MKIITRAEWGARPAVGRTVLVPASARRAVMVHHTTGEQLPTGSGPRWVRSIQHYHQDVKGWSDVGYNWLVDVAGEVYEGRGWDVQGAHCTGWNTLAWGVAYLGDGSGTPPDAALASITTLIEQACERADRELEVLGHRQHAKTACPGDDLFRWVQAGSTARAPQSPAQSAKAPQQPPGTASASAPPWPLPAGRFFGAAAAGHVARGKDLERWQARMLERGWRGKTAAGRVEPIKVDGEWGPQTEAVLRAFQAEKHLKVDGVLGPVSWAAAWEAPVTR